MDILKNFGVDPLLLAAQVVNFLIIFWLLKRFAYKPIFQMLEKRRMLIAEGVENAQKSEVVLQKAEDREKEVLKKAQQQAQETLSAAQKQAQETLAAAEDTAKVRVEKMLDEARSSIEQQTVDAEQILSKHTAQLAVKLLEKSLGNLVDSKTQKDVVTKATKKLKA